MVWFILRACKKIPSPFHKPNFPKIPTPAIPQFFFQTLNLGGYLTRTIIKPFFQTRIFENSGTRNTPNILQVCFFAVYLVGWLVGLGVGFGLV